MGRLILTLQPEDRVELSCGHGATDLALEAVKGQTARLRIGEVVTNPLYVGDVVEVRFQKGSARVYLHEVATLHKVRVRIEAPSHVSIDLAKGEAE